MKKALVAWSMMAVSILGACASADRQVALVEGIPVVNIIREPNGTETVLVGRIDPRMDFSSSFTTRSSSGIECAGEFSNRGKGVVRCSNGWVLPLTIPRNKYGTLNGSYVQAVDNIGAAVGWGTDADPEIVRALF